MSVQSDDLIREVRIEATPAEVFTYFTDPEKLVSWKAVAADSDAQPGGRFRLDITGRGDVAWGEYVEIDPPHRLTFTWRWESELADGQQPGAPGVVEVTLTPDGTGTLLRLVHLGIPRANRNGSAAGWTHYLAGRRCRRAELPNLNSHGLDRQTKSAPAHGGYSRGLSRRLDHAA